MRYSLRNKNKIVDSFGIDYYNLLIKSLQQYFSSNKEIEEFTYEKLNNKIIHVPNVQKNTDSIFEFAVIDKKYNVYNLAYYSAIS